MEHFFQYEYNEEELENFRKAEKEFTEGSIVFLNETKQFGVVNKVVNSPDGPRLKIKNIGAVPVGELRLATSEEKEAWLNRS